MPSTVEEFHGLVADLESSLAQISASMNQLIQAVTSHPAGNVVDPADLAALHQAIDEAHSIAAAAVQPPAGTPVPDTGTPPVDVTPPTAGPVENPPVDAPAADAPAGTPVLDTGEAIDGSGPATGDTPAA